MSMSEIYDNKYVATAASLTCSLNQLYTFSIFTTFTVTLFAYI